MFVNKKYVLANELVKELGISQVNISKLHSELTLIGDNSTITKMGMFNYTLLNTKSTNLPNNLNRPDVFKKLTDISNKLPLNILKSEYDLTEDDLKVLGAVPIEVLGKKWYEFSDDFVKRFKNAIPYVLDYKETYECFDKNLIDGFTNLSKNRFLTWYNIR